MRELTSIEINEVSGGRWHWRLKINLGTAFSALCVGLITGGPVGLGIAVCGLVAAQGVNELDDMYQQEFGEK